MDHTSEIEKAARLQLHWATDTCAWLIGINEGLAEIPKGTDPVCTRRVRALRLAASMREDVLGEVGPDASADEISIASASYVLVWCAKQLGFVKADDRE